MVLIVGHVESDELVALVILPLIEGEDQTAELLLGVAHLEILASAELQPGVAQASCVTDRHTDDFALLHIGGVEIAGTKEDRHHVIDAGLVFRGLPVLLAVGIDAVFLEFAVLVGVAVPYLIDIVSVALTGSLAEIEWREVGAAIRQQRVAHHEILVEPFITACDEVGFPGILALELRHLRVHRGGADLQPDKLPVEVEVVVQRLARLEGGILNTTLGLGIRGGDHATQHTYHTNNPFHTLLNFNLVFVIFYS